MNTYEMETIPGSDPMRAVTPFTIERNSWAWNRDINDQLARAAIPQPVTVTRVARD